MGFPQDRRSLEGLNMHLDVLEAEAEADVVMTPQVEATLGSLIGQVFRSRPPLSEEPRARVAEFFRRDDIRQHMIKVAVRSHSPAELRMRLIRDGTVPDEPVIEVYSRNGREYRDVTRKLLHANATKWQRTRSGRER